MVRDILITKNPDEVIDYVPVTRPDDLFHHHEVLANWIINRKIKVFCEIGVYKGKNLRNVLRGPASSIIREYWAIDRWIHVEEYWPGKTQEDWEGLYRGAVKYLPWFHQLRIIRMESVDAARFFWDGYFDFVYIDGDHRKEFVLQDINAWLPKVRKGGIIAGHDYLDRIRKNHQVKLAVNEFFGEENIIKERCSVWIKEIK